MTTWRLKTAGLASVLMLAGTLRGEQPGLPGDQSAMPKLPPDVRAYVDQLDHEQFDERQRATRALKDASVMGDEMLAAILRSSDLSLEQRIRLMSILKDRFKSTDRAAIGIGFNNNVDKPCISNLMDKFPAANEGVLRPGDVFLAVGGIELASISPSGYGQQTELIGLISSYKPGDRVPVRIFRPDKPPPAPAVNGQFGEVIRDLGKGVELEVEVPMGRRSDLRGNPERSDQQEMRLRTAWKYLLARLNISMPGESIQTDAEGIRPVMRSGLFGASNVMMTPGPMSVDEEEGQQAFVMVAADAVRRQQFRIMNNARVRLGDRIQVFASDGNQIRFGPEVSSAVIIPESAGTPEAGPPSPPDVAGALMARVERVRVEIQDAESRARDAGSPADRAAHERTAERLRAELSTVTAELDLMMNQSTAGTVAE